MVTRLDDDVWWFDLGGVNAYLVDDDALTLVDAGMPRQGNRLRDVVGEAGFDGNDVGRVLVTHYDPDHVGGLAALDGLDATIYVGAADAALVTGDARPPWRDKKGLTQRLAAPFVEPPSNPVEPVVDGDSVGSFTVYETPGHTPGHVAYVSEDLSVGLLGDAVRESGGSLRPPPKFLTGDPPQARASVRDLSERAPRFDVAAMGHGVPFERGGSQRLDDLARRL